MARKTGNEGTEGVGRGEEIDRNWNFFSGYSSSFLVARGGVK